MFTNKKTQYCLDVRPHLIDRLGSTPIKIPASYFVDIDKLEKAKDSKQSVQYQRRRAKLEDWHYLTSGLTLKLQLSKHCGPEERIDSLKIDPHKSSQLIFDKGNTIQQNVPFRNEQMDTQIPKKKKKSDSNHRSYALHKN